MTTVAQPPAARSRLGVWLMATRPKTLWAGIVPVMMGTAMAYEFGQLHITSAVCCLFVAMAMQIGANFANDYFDFINAVDDPDRLGPLRATQAGLIAPQTMRRAFILTFALAGGLSLYLCYRGGPWLAVVAALAIAAGILYTAGPLPLGYIGLGDLFAFIFFGPVATAGTFYMQTLQLPVAAIVAGIGPGLFSVAMITVNNLRDVDGDREKGKRTMAVLLGPGFAKWEYVTALTGACLIPVALCMMTGANHAAMISAVVLLAALPSIGKVFHERGTPLNQVLATTGKLQLLYAVLFVIGWNW